MTGPRSRLRLPPSMVSSIASWWSRGSCQRGAVIGMVGIASTSTPAKTRSNWATEGGPPVRGVGVEAPAVVALEVVALQQVQLEVRRELARVALLEPAEDRDQRGRIVGLGAGATEVGVVHPFAALEVDRQQRAQALGAERHG